MKVENISYIKYITLQDEAKEDYNFWLNNHKFKPVDHFKLGDLKACKFGLIKDLQHAFIKGVGWVELLEILALYTDLVVKDIAKLGIFTIKEAFKFIEVEIESINQIESIALGHAPSADEQHAGLERFEKYTIFPQIDTLALGNVLNYEKVKQLDYLTALTKLSYDADNKRYQKDYQSVIDRKHKK